VPAERFVDPAHISGLADFFKEHSKPGVAPHPALSQFAMQTPAVLRGRLRLEPMASSTAMEAYADGRVYLRSEIGWSFGGTVPMLNFTHMEFWLLTLLHAAATYSNWTGAYGDVDVLVDLVGPRTILPSIAPVDGRLRPFDSDDARERTDTEPVHATSTLDALASDGAQLLLCARRVASDLIADFGHNETTMLKPDRRILSARLDAVAWANLEHWMRTAGLPVDA